MTESTRAGAFAFTRRRPLSESDRLIDPLALADDTYVGPARQTRTLSFAPPAHPARMAGAHAFERLDVAARRERAALLAHVDIISTCAGYVRDR